MTNEPRNPFREFNPRGHEIIAAYEAGAWEPGIELPNHGSGCYGCGPNNDHGLHLVAHAGDTPGEITATYTFDDHFRGAPGLVHGGAIAALADDLFGYAMLHVLVLAVTRDLSLSYRRPLELGVPIAARTWLVDRDARLLHLGLDLRANDDVAVRATATFATVDLAHFTQYVS